MMLSTHGRRVGPAKAVAVQLAAQLADMSGRAIGAHYGIGATAVGAIHCRLAARSDVLQVVRDACAAIAEEAENKKLKWKVPV